MRAYSSATNFHVYILWYKHCFLPIRARVICGLFYKSNKTRFTTYVACLYQRTDMVNVFYCLNRNIDMTPRPVFFSCIHSSVLRSFNLLFCHFYSLFCEIRFVFCSFFCCAYLCHRPFAGPGHVTYPPFNFKTWHCEPEMKRAGKTK